MNRRVFAAAFAAALAAEPAFAQTYPSKPIRIVVGFPAGGGGDIAARTIAQPISERLGQPIVVENKPGAINSIAQGEVARAAPDGHTILLSVGVDMTLNPLQMKLPFDPMKAFAPVGFIAGLPIVIAAHPSLPAKDLKELVALAKSGKSISYATPGNGSNMHLALEYLKEKLGGDFVHVAYRGGAPATQDLLGGQVPLGVIGLPAGLPHIRAGKLRPLAVVMRNRSALAPDIPTVRELVGIEDFEFGGYFALFVPAGTPAPIVERLSAELNRALKLPEIDEKLKKSGLEPRPGTPGDLAEAVKAEAQRFVPIFKRLNLEKQK
jgi:tripartite-type tricarboxylate transporter receptor subunit TctC